VLIVVSHAIQYTEVLRARCVSSWTIDEQRRLLAMLTAINCIEGRRRDYNLLDACVDAFALLRICFIPVYGVEFLVGFPFEFKFLLTGIVTSLISGRWTSLAVRF